MTHTEALARVSAAVRGDARATSDVLRLVRPAVAKTVIDILGASHPDVDDSIQQALIAIVKALSAFRGDCRPEGYAARIAARVAIRCKRRHRRHDQYQRDLTRLEDDSASSSHDPRQLRRRTLLTKLLAQLPEEQAHALTQRAVLGVSVTELARDSGVPFNTIRSRIRLAREALQSVLRARPAWLEELNG